MRCIGSLHNKAFTPPSSLVLPNVFHSYRLLELGKCQFGACVFLCFLFLFSTEVFNTTHCCSHVHRSPALLEPIVPNKQRHLNGFPFRSRIVCGRNTLFVEVYHLDANSVRQGNDHRSIDSISILIPHEEHTPHVSAHSPWEVVKTVEEHKEVSYFFFKNF